MLIARGSRCEKHQAQAQEDRYTNRSKEWAYLYATARWKRMRKEFLREHPLCECDEHQAGAISALPATEVDHRIAHRGDPAIFWDRANWQSLAHACHSKKTQREIAERRASAEQQSSAHQDAL